MKTSTLQAAIATNAAVINLYQDVIRGFVISAKTMAGFGEKAFANEDYKLARKNRAALAKAVKLQKELITELKANHQTERVNAKFIRIYGKGAFDSVLASPKHTMGEVEASLDEIIAEKFPKKADTRPADHKSFKKAA